MAWRRRAGEYDGLRPYAIGYIFAIDIVSHEVYYDDDAIVRWIGKKYRSNCHQTGILRWAHVDY